VVVDRTWPADVSHGRRRVESYAPDPLSPLSLFDPRLADCASWSDRVVFFDIETTGLSGGAGMLPFLVGCGWFNQDASFTVRQFLLAGPAGERAVLDELERVFHAASLVVTYNGRTFDVPVMDMRWAFHRLETPTLGLPHFDMLPPARRLWAPPRGAEKTAESAWERDSSSCTLSALERSVLGFHRLDDVPGIEIPARYFRFLRTGDASIVDGVLEHNRHDLISLAALMSHALWLAREGPEACREPREQMGLGRLYERASDEPRALRAYEFAAKGDDLDTRRHALARLAMLMRREDRHEDAAAAWQSVLAGSPGRSNGLGGRGFSALERRALEALAIHHEHRAKNLAEAQRYATWLKEHVTPAVRADVDHRLKRLGRKIAARKQTREAPLLRE